MSASQLTIAFAPLDTIIGLRERILIAGTDRTSPAFDCDAVDTTRHVAAYRSGEPDQVIGCATLALEAEADTRSALVYRLRGMATDPDWQGQGVGRAMLEFVERDARSAGDEVEFVCNAREAAVGFYEACGWTCEGGLFDIPGVGPHRVMRRRPAR